jgi:hypothetical protein
MEPAPEAVPVVDTVDELSAVEPTHGLDDAALDELERSLAPGDGRRDGSAQSLPLRGVGEAGADSGAGVGSGSGVGAKDGAAGDGAERASSPGAGSESFRAAVGGGPDVRAGGKHVQPRLRRYSAEPEYDRGHWEGRPPWMRDVWILMEEPGSSSLALLVSVMITCVIVLAIGAFVAETSPHYYGRGCSPFPEIELTCTAVFTLELLVRVWCCPHRCAFFKDVWNLCDMVAVLPFYLEGVVSLLRGSQQGLGFFALVRVVRLVRVAKLVRYGRRSRQVGGMLRVFRDTVRQSWDNMKMMIFFELLTMIISGAVIYHIERGEYEPDVGEHGTWFVKTAQFQDPPCRSAAEVSVCADVVHTPASLSQQMQTVQQKQESQFITIPAGMYWTLVTVTGVGYGDMVPLSVAGKFATFVTIIAGLILIALPVSVIGGNFQRVYMELVSKEMHERAFTTSAAAAFSLAGIRYRIRAHRGALQQLQQQQPGASSSGGGEEKVLGLEEDEDEEKVLGLEEEEEKEEEEEEEEDEEGKEEEEEERKQEGDDDAPEHDVESQSQAQHHGAEELRRARARRATTVEKVRRLSTDVLSHMVPTSSRVAADGGEAQRPCTDGGAPRARRRMLWGMRGGDAVAGEPQLGSRGKTIDLTRRADGLSGKITHAEMEKKLVPKTFCIALHMEHVLRVVRTAGPSPISAQALPAPRLPPRDGMPLALPSLTSLTPSRHPVSINRYSHPLWGDPGPVWVRLERVGAGGGAHMHQPHIVCHWLN